MRAHALEIFVSFASITLAIVLWVLLKDSNSGANLLAGAALLVAGIMFAASPMKITLKY